MTDSHRWAAWLPLVAFAVILYLLPLPYYVIGPGPAKDVIPLIHIRGHPTHPTNGHFLLTAVLLDRSNVYDALYGWISDEDSVVPEEEVLLPGETPQEERRVARSQMDTSKIDAAIVALSEYADYPKRHGRGVLVERVVPETPAEGKLFAGDVITEIDGHRVDTPRQLSRQIDRIGFRNRGRFTVHAAGKTRHPQITPGRVRGVEGPAIGITAVHNFPFEVSISSGEIGGPSAGLMWTLGLIDLLTPGELANGRTIAGTGQILPDGTVESVGGIEQKVAAAERAGASVFFVPAQEAAQATSIATKTRVVPVQTYRDAVRFLGGRAGEG
ncbi:MAG TPA: S16 family serine protease [Actinomycetota bacterium]|nr:S16 family serine protease [Actinomycetota bacterium]